MKMKNSFAATVDPIMSRRSFLGGLAGTMALPLLGSGRSSANTGSFPTRFLVFFTPNGTNPGRWFPDAGASETDFTLKPQHAALLPFQNRLLYLHNVGMESQDVGPGEPHQRGMGAVLTGTHLQPGDFVGGDGSLAGWANGISVDQTIAGVIGGTTRFKSVELGARVNGSEVRHRLNYAGPAQPLPSIEDPRAAWNHLFADFQQPEQNTDNTMRRRRSVLDAANRQIAQLRGRVSLEDRNKLDRHYTLLRELEMRIGGGQLADACVIPERPAERNASAEENMATVIDDQIRLATASLACDVTRVVTLQMSSSANNIRFPHLQSYSDDHSLSHAGPEDSVSQEEWASRQSWYAQRFATLLSQLDAVPEGDGTLLDHTLVFWCSELAQGNTHSHANMPFLIAGGASGKIQTGRYVRYSERRRHNDLLVALLHAMGIEMNTFGNPDFCSGGPLSGILA